MKLESGRLLTRDQLKQLLVELSTGPLQFTESNVKTSILPPFKKLGVLIDYDDIEDAQETKLPTYKNIGNTRTTQSQTFKCVQCRRQLPTAHLLDLHIIEQHDFYFAASVERGSKPHYACYIEECPLKFSKPTERKDHCIEVHKFPANYRFDQEKFVKTKNRKSKEIDVMDVDISANNTPSCSDGRFTHVKAFSFGHPTQRTFRSVKQRGFSEALLDVKAIKEALNDME